MEETLSMARRLAGDMADEVLLTALCQAAEAQVAGALKKNVAPEQVGNAFFLGAAFLAVSYYVACALGREDGRSFQIGDVAVRGGSPKAVLTAVQELQKQARTILGAHIRDDSLILTGV